LGFASGAVVDALRPRIQRTAIGALASLDVGAQIDRRLKAFALRMREQVRNRPRGLGGLFRNPHPERCERGLHGSNVRVDLLSIPLKGAVGLIQA
jgi:hypothetical protein